MHISLDALLSHLADPEEGALSEKAITRLRLGEDRPLPVVARAVLARRRPAWRVPGMWARGAGTSLRGERIDKLVLRQLKAPDFNPNKYWDVGALAAALPGACHPLDADLPLSFLYVAGPENDDYPVLTLQQSDDVLDVVVEAPSLLVYYAMQVGLVPSPRYSGGLYARPELAEAMRESVRRCGLEPRDDASRLFFEAPRKDEPERAPRVPSSDAATPPAPSWIGEVFVAYTNVLREAWSLVQSADDAALVAAFEAAKATSKITRIEARKAKTLRARLGQVQHDYYHPNILMLFWMALELDARRGEALVRDALSASIEGDYSAAGLRPHFVHIGAARFWSVDEARKALLDELLVQQGDPRNGGLIDDLGRAVSAIPGISTDEILRRAEALVSGAVPGKPGEIIDSLLVACVALLARDRRKFTSTVHELGARMAEHLEPAWGSLVVQCTSAAVRRAADG